VEDQDGVGAALGDPEEHGPACPEADGFGGFGSFGKERERDMKEIVVTIRDGMVQYVKAPRGIRVVVRDFDTDGILDEMLQQDEHEGVYLKTVYENDGRGIFNYALPRGG